MLLGVGEADGKVAGCESSSIFTGSSIGGSIMGGAVIPPNCCCCVKLLRPSDSEIVGAPIERAIVVLKPVSADFLTNSQQRISIA